MRNTNKKTHTYKKIIVNEEILQRESEFNMKKRVE